MARTRASLRTRDRKSVEAGKRGDRRDWSSGVCSADLRWQENLLAAFRPRWRHRRSFHHEHRWLGPAPAYAPEIGRASRRGRGEIAVTGVQACALPISDGRRICWRRFAPDGATAEVFTMNTDGSDPRQLTHL